MALLNISTSFRWNCLRQESDPRELTEFLSTRAMRGNDARTKKKEDNDRRRREGYKVTPASNEPYRASCRNPDETTTSTAEHGRGNQPSAMDAYSQPEAGAYNQPSAIDAHSQPAGANNQQPDGRVQPTDQTHPDPGAKV